jgi:hypothetical protein
MNPWISRRPRRAPKNAGADAGIRAGESNNIVLKQIRQKFGRFGNAALR